MALVTYAKVVNVQDITSCSIVVNFAQKYFSIASVNGNRHAHEMSDTFGRFRYSDTFGRFRHICQ